MNFTLILFKLIYKVGNTRKKLYLPIAADDCHKDLTEPSQLAGEFCTLLAHHFYRIPSYVL